MVKPNLTCMQYTCKNPDCQKAFNYYDFLGRMSLQKWRYCDECCEKYGYVNPEFPPKKKLSEKQKEVLKKNQFQKRKKSDEPSLNMEDE